MQFKRQTVYQLLIFRLHHLFNGKLNLTAAFGRHGVDVQPVIILPVHLQQGGVDPFSNHGAVRTQGFPSLFNTAFPVFAVQLQLKIGDHLAPVEMEILQGFHFLVAFVIEFHFHFGCSDEGICTYGNIAGSQLNLLVE